MAKNGFRQQEQDGCGEHDQLSSLGLLTTTLNFTHT